MPASVVKNGPATGESVAASTRNVPVATGGHAAGNVLLIVAQTPSSSITAISDSRGNTYSLLKAGNPGVNDIQIWASRLSVALQDGDVVTIQTSTSVAMAYVYGEIAGLSTGTLVRATDGSNAISTTANAAFTTGTVQAAAGDFVIGAITVASSGSTGTVASYANGWAVFGAGNPSTGSARYTRTAFRVEPTGGSIQPTMTLNGAKSGQGIALSLYAAENAPASPSAAKGLPLLGAA